MRITVIGAGVIGLTSAIRLREAGFDASIVTRDLPLETPASSNAGAVWYPYGARADDRVLNWGRVTLDLYYGQAEQDVGVTVTEMLEVLPVEAGDPWWSSIVRSYRHARHNELPPGYLDGWVVEGVCVDPLRYLEFLVDRFVHLGGAIGQQDVASFDELSDGDTLVVNCTGAAAGALTEDDDIHPVRGQIVRIKNPGIDKVTIDERGPLAIAYVIPHKDECVLGGTVEPGEWNQIPSEEVTAAIIEKCTILAPAVAHPDIVEVRVGLRPGRHDARLEYEQLPDAAGVIHNYGHAGAGWSLAWGCAAEVVTLAERVAG
jgi:D-amino-acid oxidase